MGSVCGLGNTNIGRFSHTVIRASSLILNKFLLGIQTCFVGGEHLKCAPRWEGMTAVLFSDRDFERLSKPSSRPYYLTKDPKQLKPRLHISPRRRYDNIVARIHHQSTFNNEPTHQSLRQSQSLSSLHRFKRPPSATLSFLAREENARNRQLVNSLSHSNSLQSSSKKLNSSVSLPDLNGYDQRRADEKYKALQASINAIVAGERFSYLDLQEGNADGRQQAQNKGVDNNTRSKADRVRAAYSRE